MSVELASTIWLGISTYLVIGLIVALIFHVMFIKRVSEGARTSAPLQMRLIIFPACVALWPVLVMKSARVLFQGGANETST